MQQPEMAAGDRLPAEHALYEDAPCGLLVTTVDGVIRRVNRTFCRWVGRDAGELVDRVKVQDLLTMGGRIFHQTHWTPLLQMQGSVAEVKLEVVHGDGHKVPMVFNAMRRAHGGMTVHELAVFVAEDRHRYERELLAARRRAEESLGKEKAAQQALQIAQAERDRQQAVAEDRALFAEQMVAIVSHDLRNPLSVIRMSAHLIGRGELSSSQLRALGRLTNSSALAARLIADLLDFSQARLGSGLRLSVEPIDLHALVSDCVEDLRLAFPGRTLAHRCEGEGRPTASADRLVQLIGNLVANAAVHGAKDGPVRVTSTITDASFSIAVHNEGPAIDAALLPRLFDPMTRGADARDARHSVGLGLFIVREIAKAHGGTVSVESSDRVGTTFTAAFPRDSAVS